LKFSNLNFSIALKYGLVSIGSNEVSLWLAETIKSLIDESKSMNNQFDLVNPI
jgi:hypothetical protein